jgi:dihydrofolate reductase
MSKVFAEMSMSLDGFIAGPNDNVDRLHEWLYDLSTWRAPHGMSGGENNQDADVMDESFKRAGAFVMGRRMFNLAEEPWGSNPPFHSPVFVVTHEAREPLAKEGGTAFHFVTTGVEGAIRQAKAAAGDKDVSVSGGANTIQQCLKSGLVDELIIHLIPVLLGGGILLFESLGNASIELESTRVIDSPKVTHLQFRVMK